MIGQTFRSPLPFSPPWNYLRKVYAKKLGWSRLTIKWLILIAGVRSRNCSEARPQLAGTQGAEALAIASSQSEKPPLTRIVTLCFKALHPLGQTSQLCSLLRCSFNCHDFNM